MFALVDANNFFASCERIFRPDLWGKPVIVLSNNDGCVISRSEEAKRLKIKMGAPYFQVSALCKAHQITVFSSNYVLYGDISHRMMHLILDAWPEVEVYSIDEVFLKLEGLEESQIKPFCQQLISMLRKHIGIPVSIGVGTTKTLAKLANSMAKQHLKKSFFHLRETDALSFSQLDVSEVWGVGRKLAPQLRQDGICTVLELQRAPLEALRARYSVMMAKTIQELRGIACHILETDEPKQTIVSSRSFGEKQTHFEPIREALASYCAKACAKIRKQGSWVGYVQVFLRTSPFCEVAYRGALSLALTQPTQDTRTVIAAASALLKRIYKPGYVYQKVGVLLGDLRSSSEIQTDLFSEQGDTQARSQTLMSLMDALNTRFGKRTLQFAAEGTLQPWRMKQGHCSPAYTTQWDELVLVS